MRKLKRVKEEVVEETKDAGEGSQMIFPKLEKESPEASIQMEAPAAAEEPQEEADDSMSSLTSHSTTRPRMVHDG